MIRFEILLPLFYNDGRPIEDERFVETDDELVQLFGATSTDSVVVVIGYTRVLATKTDWCEFEWM
jgi:hypothetical protein